MSDNYDTYIHYGRLIVILQFFLIPIYFYLLALTFSGSFISFLDETLSNFIVYVIGPLIMAVPFFFWTIGRRYQIGDAYEMFGREVWRLPTTIKAFYGFNFIIGVIFVTPLLIPIISLFGGYFIAIYLLNWREEGKLISTQRKTIILTLLYLPLPFLVVLGFYFGYNSLSGQSGIIGFFFDLLSMWNDQIDVFYMSALILADCATIGGVFYLIYEGAQQVDHTVTVPGPIITILSIISFLILESLYLLYPLYFGEFLRWIHIGAVIVGVFVLIIRYWKGLVTRETTSITGWITLVIFQAVNFLPGAFERISRSSAIILAFTIFLVIFYISYKHASKRY
ncbi:MAG: hypothetical protein ACFFAU_15395 [Candidatus Hodarchaeota archaeon]